MKSETISVKVTKDLKDKVTRAAEDRNLSLSNYAVQALEEKSNGNTFNGDLAKHIGTIINSIKELTEFEDSENKNKIKESIYSLENYIINSYNAGRDKL